MKKFLIFAGRKHHAQKLFGQYLYLDGSKDSEVSWLIAQNSINIDPASEFIYTYSKSRGSVIHLYDNVLQNTVGRILSRYEKLKGKIATQKAIDNVPPFWLLQGLREAIEVDCLSQDLFRQQKPDGLLVLHTNNFWGRILAFNAQNQNIPVFAFQEGVLRDLDQKTMNKQSMATDYVDVMFVWTENDKQRYLDAGAKCEIVVSGPAHLDYPIRNLPQIDNMKDKFRKELEVTDDESKIIGLALPLRSQYEGNIGKDIFDICRWAFIHDHHVLFRPHPFDENLSSEVENILGVVNSAVTDATKWDIGKFLMACDVVLGQHSTVGIESVILKTPFFEFGRGENSTLESKEYANYLDIDQISSWGNFTNSADTQKYCDGFLEQNEEAFSGYASIKIGKTIESYKSDTGKKNDRRKKR